MPLEMHSVVKAVNHGMQSECLHKVFDHDGTAHELLDMDFFKAVTHPSLDDSTN